MIASSKFKLEIETSNDFDRSCLDGVAGIKCWSVFVSCLIVFVDVAGEEETDDRSPGLDPTNYKINYINIPSTETNPEKRLKLVTYYKDLTIKIVKINSYFTQNL